MDPLNRKYSDEEKQQLIANLDIEGSCSIIHRKTNQLTFKPPQSPIEPVNSNHGSKTV
jgi:hypothetical protein